MPREQSTDPRVVAIRDDKRVGRGSCSVIDECWGDAELIVVMDQYKITEATAVKFAHELQGRWLEEGLNQRWGEDDDPQLQSYREWNGLDTSFNDKKTVEEGADDEPPHRRGCVCADCSGAELTSDND